MALSQAKTEGEFQAEMNDIIMNEDTKSKKSASAKDTHLSVRCVGSRAVRGLSLSLQ